MLPILLSTGVGFFTSLIRRIKKTDASKLQDEYAKLVEGLQEAGDSEDGFMANPGQRLSVSYDIRTA